jgi:antitoxin component of RelBE/YafQ-DinJ toxin-antitoxin module
LRRIAAPRRNHRFSIKRVAKEGALPVQVISYDQIEKQGITSAEQLMQPDFRQRHRRRQHDLG